MSPEAAACIALLNTAGFHVLALSPLKVALQRVGARAGASDEFATIRPNGAPLVEAVRAWIATQSG